MVECFATGSQCIITQRCRLPNVLNEALHAFIDTLDGYTLADIVLARRDFRPSKESVRGQRGPEPALAGRAR
jgi:Rrf2 family nitric oxide-sensitive transcriptional repressor